jgi:hypothetical protein
MKNLIVLVVILIAKSTFALQKDTAALTTPFVNGQVVYEKVFSAPKKTKSQLYSNAQLWFLKHYRFPNSVQIADSINGRVVGRGIEILSLK